MVSGPKSISSILFRTLRKAKFGTRLVVLDYEEPLSYEGVVTIAREWEQTRWYEDWDNSDKGRVSGSE